MADYFFAILFLLVYEILSLPLRLAMMPIPMSGDLRRMISRLVGPAMIGVTAWFFAHFGIPLGFVTGWIFFGLFAAGGYQLCKWQGLKPDWKALIHPITDKKRWKREVFVEVFSLLIFFTMLWFRRIVPEMTTTALNGAGSEKFDNSEFFWSAWHARTLPPEDYWLAGARMPYYYYGHFFWGWIGRMGLFPGEWVVTLAMARLVQAVWESSYLLIRAFGMRAISAAIGAFFIAWGGNPHAIRTFADQYDRVTGRSWEPADKRKSRFDSSYRAKLKDYKWNYGDYMYWDPAHGVIPGTIVEYPAWTAILGDFHAHHFSLPWTLTFVAILLAGDRWFKLRRKLLALPIKPRMKKRDPERPPPEALRRLMAARVLLALACFLVMGVSAILSNQWVVPLIGVAALGLVLWKTGWGFAAVSAELAAIGLLLVFMLGGVWLEMGTLKNPVTATVTQAAPVITTGINAPPPKPLMERIFAKLPVKPLPKTIRSTMPEILRHWGYQVAALALGLAAYLVSRRRTFKGWVGWAPIIGCGVFALVVWIMKAAVFKREPILFWIGMTWLMAIFAIGRRRWLRPLPALYLALTCFLLGGLEFYFVDDPMAGALERYNSYFKLCFPAWGLLTAGAWIAAHRIWFLRAARPARWAMRSALIASIPPIMAMVIFGVPSRIQSTTMSDIVKRKPTLNAYSWLANFRSPIDNYEYTSEEKMLAWIRRNVPPRERVAEAVSWWVPTAMEREPKDLRPNINYAYVGRVASVAGRPIPLGWEGHEYTWRTGEAAEPVAKNREALKALFYAPTPDAMRKAAKELKTRWVVFGKSERDIFNDPKSGTTAEDVYQVLRQAGKLRFMHPEDKPKVFVFEIEWPEE